MENMAQMFPSIFNFRIRPLPPNFVQQDYMEHPDFMMPVSGRRIGFPGEVPVPLRSINNDEETHFRIYNPTSRPIGIYWIDYSGAQIIFGSVLPGQNATLKTFVTHPWLFRETLNDDTMSYVIDTPNIPQRCDKVFYPVAGICVNISLREEVLPLSEITFRWIYYRYSFHDLMKIDGFAKFFLEQAREFKQISFVGKTSEFCSHHGKCQYINKD